MVEGEPGYVLVDEYECWTTRIFVGPQSMKYALSQGGLARAEVPRQQDDLTHSSTQAYFATYLAR